MRGPSRAAGGPALLSWLRFSTRAVAGPGLVAGQDSAGDYIKKSPRQSRLSHCQSDLDRTITNFINSKRCRFSFNGAFNDVILSKNARLILESAYIPAITNLNGYINIRIVTRTEDVVVDTQRQNNGNPMLLTFSTTNQTIINGSETFYNSMFHELFIKRLY